MICVIQNIKSACFLVQGIKKGDRVSIYLPMIPELVYAMLACARIGAVHSIVVSRWMFGLCLTHFGDTDMSRVFFQLSDTCCVVICEKLNSLWCSKQESGIIVLWDYLTLYLACIRFNLGADSHVSLRCLQLLLEPELLLLLVQTASLL